MGRVFQNESNWSAYQDKQLDVLNSIGNSFNSSLKISKSLESSLSKVESAMESLAKSATSLAGYVSTISSSGRRGRGGNSRNSFDNIVRNLEQLHAQEKSRMEERHKQSIENLEEELRASREENQDKSEQRKKQEVSDKSHRDTIVGILNIAKSAVETIGKSANNYSTASNQLIKLSGMRGDEVRSFRGEFLDIVSDLNKKTGYAYDPQKSYLKLVEISQSVTGNLESLKTMSKPLLLAQETLDVNLGSIGSLFNKFYTRYNFSSLAMEDMVDDIRSSSANNQATAEDIVNTITATSSLLEYLSGGDNDKLSQYTEELSKITAYYGSFGLSTDFIPQLLKDIDSGEIWSGKDNLAANGLLSLGYDANSAKEALKDPTKLISIIDAVIQSKSDFFGRISNSPGYYAAVESMSQDAELLREAYNYIQARDKADYTYETFVNNLDNTSSEDLVEDKYYSLQEQANNWLEGIYGELASWQEKLGIGFSDIAALLGLIAMLVSSNKISSFLSGGTGGSAANLLSNGLARGVVQSGGTAGLSSGATIGTSLASIGQSVGIGAGGVGSAIGGAATVAAPLAIGGAGAYYGISEGIDDYKKDHNVRGTANIAGGVAMGVGGATVAGGMLAAGAANVWNPVGWGLLIAGAATLVGTTIHKATTSVSGAAESLTEEFENSYEKIKKEHLQRITNIDSLKEAVLQTDNESEAIKAVVNSGLIPMEDASGKSKDELLLMIEALKNTSTELYNLGDAAFESAKKILNKTATEEDEKVNKAIKEAVMNSSGWNKETGELTKEANKYDFDRYYAAFESMAETITDEEKRKETLEMVETIFSNGILSEDELDVLTDLGGNWNAFWRTTVDRDRAPSRQGRDMSAYNEAVKLGFGIEGFTAVAGKDILVKLQTAASKGDKDAFLEAWNQFSEEQKKLYRGSYEDAAKKLGIEKFAEGSNYIASNRIALLHEGEAVVPKKYNPAINSAEFQEISDRLHQDHEESSEDTAETNYYLSSFLSEIKELRNFLAMWKAENIQREKQSAIQSRFSAYNNYFNSFTGGQNV